MLYRPTSGTTLTKWQVIKVPAMHGYPQSYHLVGNAPNGNGRVTSQIVSVDIIGRTFVTHSGNKYTVSGDATKHLSDDALYVLHTWLDYHNVPHIDATEEFFNENKPSSDSGNV